MPACGAVPVLLASSNSELYLHCINIRLGGGCRTVLENSCVLLCSLDNCRHTQLSLYNNKTNSLICCVSWQVQEAMKPCSEAMQHTGYLFSSTALLDVRDKDTLTDLGMFAFNYHDTQTLSSLKPMRNTQCCHTARWHPATQSSMHWQAYTLCMYSLSPVCMHISCLWTWPTCWVGLGPASRQHGCGRQKQ